MNNNISNKTLNFIKKWEGLSLKSYKCSANVWTIGYGNTFYENKEAVKEGDIISIEKAEKLLKSYLINNINISYLNDYILNNENKITALYSLIYNIGQKAFDNSTLKKYLKEYKNNENIILNQIIKEQWLKWCRVGKEINNGLVKRRQEEIDMFFLKNK